MAGRLEPLGSDLSAAKAWGRRALRARAAATGEPQPWADRLEERLAAGGVCGRLWLDRGRIGGFVAWTVGLTPGASVQLWLVDPPGPGGEGYARLLEALQHEVGRVAFLPGPLVGVPADSEDRLLRGRGFRRFGRSEMALGPQIPLPEVTDRPGLRAIVPEDLPALAELHRDAYHGSFDRFLFSEIDDELESARQEIRDLWEGRWGSYAPEGSWTLEEGGRLLGAVLSVRTEAGALVADVAVGPGHRRRGVGRAVLLRALHGLRSAHAGPIYLNVTEGNAPAFRLYERLGFARSRGPSRDWYHAGAVPIAPSPDA